MAYIETASAEMSTAVAAPSPAPMGIHERHPSPRSYATLAPAISQQSAERYGNQNGGSDAITVSSNERTPPGGKKSPLAYVRSMIIHLRY